MALTTLLASTQSAYAALTIGATTIRSDGALNSSGAAASASEYADLNTTGNVTIGKVLTSGTVTIGGTAQTGTITIGQNATGTTSTVDISSAAGTASTQTVNIAGGTSTTSGGKVVNIANGIPGSSTTNTVAIGSGGTTTGTVGVTVGSNGAAAHTLVLQGGTGTGSNAAIKLSPAAAGDIAIGAASHTGGTLVTSSSANALTVGRQGSTNPAFQVDASTASSLTGLKATAAGTGGGYALAVVETGGTNNALTIDAMGSGTITLNGTATGNVTTPRGLVSTGATAGIGYATGAGGAVTQSSSRTTGVTLNKVTGEITLVSAAGSTTPASFTVTNSAVAATDTIVVSQQSGSDLYEIFVTNVAAGSFKITFFTTGGTTTEQPKFNFAVIKGAAS